MKIFDIQMNDIIIENITNFINGNVFFNTLSIIITIISFFQEFLERYREKNWKKTLCESILLFALLLVLTKIKHRFFALFIISLFTLGMTFFRRFKQSKKIIAATNDNHDAQTSDLFKDSKESDYAPEILSFSKSAYKNAQQCLAENRPKEAIRYLTECREKEKGQVRFATRYADALIMLGNYSGALAKLKFLPDSLLKKKKRYKSVMIRMAACYHGLNKYVEELNCYDKVIASNYKPEKYPFYRGKVKVRLLEIYPYVKEAENVIFQTFGSKENFIMSAIADFDKTLKYGNKYKAAVLSYKGICFFYLADYLKTLEFLYESSDLNDSLANNYVYFGLYYYQNKNNIAAEKYLENAISLGADNEIPYMHLAQINYSSGIYDTAISYASGALSFLPSISECYGIQGTCYKEKKMYAEAITCYTRAIELKPKAEYFQWRANCYFNKSGADYKKAYNDILQALTLNDTPANRLDAILYKAKMQREENYRPELGELRKLIQPYSTIPSYYNTLGIIFSAYDYLDEAEQYYRKAIEYDKSMDAAHYNLAIQLKKVGRLNEAVEHAKTAIALNSMEKKYFSLLESCYNILDDTCNEVAIQKDIKSLNRKHLMVNKKNGDAVYRTGKYSEAESYYRMALNYVADDPATLNNLACTCYYQEQYSQAIEFLENAIAQKSSYYLAYFNLGNCYLRTNTKEKNQNLAMEKYEKARQLSSQFNPAIQMLESMNPANIKMIIDVNS